MLALLATACATDAWPLEPAGPQAGGIATLWWAFLAVAAAVWAATLATLAWAVIRGRRRDAPALDPATRRTQVRAVGGAAAATVLILVALAAGDFLASRGLMAATRAPDPLTVRVTGHRWWWELTYEPHDPARRFTTANELRIPTGRPVLLELESADVIHSFWVPRLQGKRDLIPGYTTVTWIAADEPGVLDGSCAEFCGLQHARMRLEVVAEPPERFDAWYEAQRADALPPADSAARRGQQVFLTGPCALCHAVRGTPARGQVAPDLTHLASRRMIAAATVPNTRGWLGGWIVDPHGIKPGVAMPPNPLPAADLEALLHYLEGLR